MYQKLPNLVLGFHGCRKEVFESVVYQGEALKASENEYDWLGHGIYFWEQNYQRAVEWATNRYGTEHAVIGAVIDGAPKKYLARSCGVFFIAIFRGSNAREEGQALKGGVLRSAA